MIITKEKVQFYKKIEGDLDTREPLSNHGVTIEELYTINNLFQDIYLMKKGLLSEELKKKLMEKLDALCKDEDAKKMLLGMV